MPNRLSRRHAQLKLPEVESMEARMYLSASFLAPIITPVTGQPLKIATADFNGDGLPDVVVSTFQGNLIPLLNAGAGHFTVEPSVHIGGTHGNLISLAAGILPGSSHDDLIAPGATPGTVAIALGNGVGTFQSITSVSTGAANQITQVALADFNRDGNLDIIATDAFGDLFVLSGNPNGTFQAPLSFAVPGGNDPSALTLSDVNHDGDPDIIIGNEDGSIDVVLGDGNSTFGTVTHIASVGANIAQIAVADVNDDGNPDLIIAAQGNDTVPAVAGNLVEITGDGFGYFNSPITLPGGRTAIGVIAADFGDGNTSIIDAAFGDNQIDVNDSGQVTTFPTEPGPGAMVAADFTGDGTLAIAIASEGSDAVDVLLSTQAAPVITVNNGVLTSTGTNGADTCFASLSGTTLSITADGNTQTFPFPSITSLILNLGGGNDSVDIGANIPGVQASGGAGNDTLRGGGAGALLQGGQGKDLIVGGKGAATLVGGAGTDTIAAGKGQREELLGGAGNDFFISGAGSNDTVNGGAGLNFAQNNSLDVMASIFEDYDPLPPGSAPAVITPGASVTASIVGTELKIIGTSGNDTVSVTSDSQGNLQVTANGSPDGTFSLSGLTGVVIIGAAGNDNLSVAPSVLLPATLRGAGGNDSLSGGGASNVLVGSAGNDTLRGGATGTSLLVPGARLSFAGVSGGDDLLIGGGSYAIADFSRRTDNLVLSNNGVAHSGGAGETTTIMPDVSVIWGGSANDSIALTSAGDFASGGSGNDTITGGGALNVLVGGEGSDSVAAGSQGNNALFLRDGSADMFMSSNTDLLQLDLELDT